MSFQCYATVRIFFRMHNSLQYGSFFSDSTQLKYLLWLPKRLPPNVKILVSLTSASDAWKSIQKDFVDKKQALLEIPEWSPPDAELLMKQRLQQVGRRLSSSQYQVATEAYKAFPVLLYLKVLLQESELWPSSLLANQIRLGKTVRGAAAMLFGRMEKQHGEALVRRTLGYLSATRNGITENELEDLLSLDIAAMGEVSAHSHQTLHKLPSMYWLRMRHDLSEYLQEVMVDGLLGLKWRHGDFLAAASERYLVTRDKAPSYHKAIADYFLGKRGNVKREDNASHELYWVTSQPLYWEEADEGRNGRIYNLRRLSELPYQLVQCQQIVSLKSNCLCNFEFLLGQLLSNGVVQVQEDVAVAAASMETPDEDLRLLSETLQLSVDVLHKDPQQLASQLIGRLHDIITADKPSIPTDPPMYPSMKRLLAQTRQWSSQARQCSSQALLPSKTCLASPGGDSYRLLSAHGGVITAVCASPDGHKAVTSSRDDTLRMWHLHTGTVISMVTGVGSNVLQVRMATNETVITSEKAMIRVWNMDNQVCVGNIPTHDPAAIAVALDGQAFVTLFNGSNTMQCWSLVPELSSIQKVTLTEHVDTEAGSTQDDTGHSDRSILVPSQIIGSYLLYAYTNNSSAAVRKVKTGRLMYTLKVHVQGSVVSVGCSSEYFICATKYKYLEVHDTVCLELFGTQDGKPVRSIRGCTVDNLCEIHVNRIGSHAIGTCYSSKYGGSHVAVWNLETEDHKHLSRHPGVSRHSACADFRFCVTISDNQSSAKVWDLSHKINQQMARQKVKHGVDRIFPIAAHPQYVLVKAGAGGRLTVWNLTKGKSCGSIVRIEKGLVDDSDVLLLWNTRLVILGNKGLSDVSDERLMVYRSLFVYDLLQRKFTHRVKGCYIVPCPVHEYRMLSDEHLMGLSESRNHFVVWSIVTGQVVYRIRKNFREGSEGMIQFQIPEVAADVKKKAGPERILSRRHTGRSGTSRGRRRLEDHVTDTKHLEQFEREKSNAIDRYIISEDLSTMVVSYYAHHLCVFDIPSRRHTHTLDGRGSMMYLYAAAMTPDGRHLVHANYDEESKTSYVTAWNCKTGNLRKRLRNERDVCCVAISDDSSRVVFGKSGNKGLRVWDLGARAGVRRMAGTSSVTLEEDSRLYVGQGGSRAVLYSGSVSVWDLDNACLISIFTPDRPLQAFTVALDGRMMIFGVEDSTEPVMLTLSGRGEPDIQNWRSENLFGEEDSSSSESEDEEEET